MEHIIAEKHDGITESGNLALSCPCCNRFKGTDLGSIDPETGQLRELRKKNELLAAALGYPMVSCLSLYY